MARGLDISLGQMTILDGHACFRPALDTTLARGARPETFSGRRVELWNDSLLGSSCDGPSRSTLEDR